MRFQVTERIYTNASAELVKKALDSNFRKIASSVVSNHENLKVQLIHASFGSINRFDETDISIKPSGDGLFLTADVNYRPSILFWVFFLLSLFSFIGWLIPVAFYLYQKDTVKRAIEDVFRNIGNEFTVSNTSVQNKVSSSSAITDLERLGKLLKQGLITQEEFDQQKKIILGYHEQPKPNQTTAAAPSNPDKTNAFERLATARSNSNDERASEIAYEQAKELLGFGQNEMAIDILNSIVNRFPDSKAADSARKKLSAISSQ